ncbi:MAG: hypothetical protein JO288_04070, partial [Hyphomicrobiales bacterium]|nr:hypothetical protein [Hyphomicrobiales bacterium]
MAPVVNISVVRGDAFSLNVDVLVLKYAQTLYGVDKIAFMRLRSANIDVILPTIGGFNLQNSRGSMDPRYVLFVGVKHLGLFGYAEIRDFARNSLCYLAQNAPQTGSVALTIHGPGYGLDESEAFESELAGVVDAVANGQFPLDLSAVTFVEADPKRAIRLTQLLNKLLPRGSIPVDDRTLRSAPPESVTSAYDQAGDTLRTVGYASSAKAHAFVAMPFATEMDDTFHYGIQSAVNSVGLLCERGDSAAFTGDVLDWVRRRIASATLVIADLTSANPNVYLEVGYAWGCRIPTVLLVRNPDELKFDAKGQRCLVYKSIRHLEELLQNELSALLARNS